MVSKAGVAINSVSRPGAAIGEISLLLDSPYSATVVASAPSIVRFAADGRAFLMSDPAITRVIAAGLAERLNFVTTYLVDLKHQYGDSPGLAMVSEVLGHLAHRQGPPARARLGPRARTPTTDRASASDSKPNAGRVRPPGSSASSPIIECHEAVPAARSITMWARHRPDLPAGIEHPGGADAVGPGARRLERRLVHMAGQHQFGPVLGNPGREVGVAVLSLAGPASGRAQWRPVIDPDPARGPSGGIGGQLQFERRPARPGRPTRGRS